LWLRILNVRIITGEETPGTLVKGAKDSVDVARVVDVDETKAMIMGLVKRSVKR
jgi:hypothetical protein